MKTQAMNPYLPGYEHVPDGEPYVFGDRVYIYGSHDMFGGDDFCMLDYVGWSAPTDDPGNWRYEGVIYDRKKDPYYKEGCKLFAPDVAVGADGRYYLFYAFDISGTIGVACCDEPAGEFEYYGHIHYPDGTLLGRKGEPFQYDPAVLRDDDGRVYLYTGFCVDTDKIPRFRGMTPNKEGAMLTELEEDMVTIKRPYRYIVPSSFKSAGTGFEGHAFFEAPSIRKANGRYYFIYSSEVSHELCYAVSDKPDGGFSYGGVIVSNGDIGYKGNKKALNYTGTNHGSIECIDGCWYIFYHRQTNGCPYGRQGCAEPIAIGEDGFIAQVPITSCGLNKGPLKGEGTYPAGIACCLMSRNGAVQYAAKTHVDETHPYFWHEGGDWDPGVTKNAPVIGIRNMRDKARAGYRYFDLKDTGHISFEIRGKASGELVITDGMESTAKELGRITVGPCADFTWFGADLQDAKDNSELWITFEGEGALNLNRFTLSVFSTQPAKCPPHG